MPFSDLLLYFYIFRNQLCYIIVIFVHLLFICMNYSTAADRLVERRRINFSWLLEYLDYWSFTPWCSASTRGITILKQEIHFCFDFLWTNPDLFMVLMEPPEQKIIYSQVSCSFFSPSFQRRKKLHIGFSFVKYPNSLLRQIRWNK